MAFKLSSPFNLLTKEGREKRKKKRNFKKKVKSLKKANKTQAGQYLWRASTISTGTDHGTTSLLDLTT